MTWSSQCSRMARWPGVLHVPEWPEDLFVTWSPPCSKMARWPACDLEFSIFQNGQMTCVWPRVLHVPEWPGDLESSMFQNGKMTCLWPGVLHVPEWPDDLWPGGVYHCPPCSRISQMTCSWPGVLHVPEWPNDLLMAWICHPLSSMFQNGQYGFEVLYSPCIQMSGWPTYDLISPTFSTSHGFWLT